MQIAADGPRHLLGIRGIFGASHVVHATYILDAEALVASNARDGAALLIHVEQDGYATGFKGVLLCVGEHLSGLLGVEEIVRKVYDSAHGANSQGIACHVVGSGYCLVAITGKQALWCHHKQLRHFLLDRERLKQPLCL